ncbi:MAG: hypothetical protein M0P10_02900 [Sphaerochaetaceae bacterium]|nr:hypothetical protein [Sphaerochaetaceae bacterium]
MRRRNFYTRNSQLYPSEMGAFDFGMYRNLSKENDFEYSIKNEKYENLIKNSSRKNRAKNRRK